MKLELRGICLFVTGLFHLNTVSSRSICVVAGFRTAFLFRAEQYSVVCLRMVLYLYSGDVA